MAKKKIPVLIGWTEKNWSAGKNSAALKIHVWCPFCAREHHHGLPDGNPNLTHRWAHCSSDAPGNFLDTGYWIKAQKGDPAWKAWARKKKKEREEIIKAMEAPTTYSTVATFKTKPQLLIESGS